MPSATHTAIFHSGTPPHVQFTASVSGLTVSVDAAGSYGTSAGLGFSAWDFGDGGSGTGAMASHTYGAAGSYTITYTGFQEDGQSASTQQSITISSGGSSTGHVWDLLAGKDASEGLPSSIQSQYLNYTDVYVAGDSFQQTINRIPSGSNKILMMPNGSDIVLSNFNQPNNSGFFGSQRIVGIGCLGGPTQSRILMQAGSLTSAQISHLNGLTSGSTDYYMGFVGNGSSDTSHPVYLFGMTFEMQEQNVNMLNGMSLYYAQASGTSSYVQYCRFIACGVSTGGSPPEETSQLGQTRGMNIIHRKNEFCGALRNDTAGPGTAGFVDPNYDTTRRRAGSFQTAATKGVTLSDIYTHDAQKSGISFSLAGSDNGPNTDQSEFTSNVTTTNLQVDDNDNHDTSGNGFPGINHEVVQGSVVHNNPTISLDTVKVGQGHISWIGYGAANPSPVPTLRVNGGTFSTIPGYANGMLVIKSNYGYTGYVKWPDSSVSVYNNSGALMTMYTSASAASSSGATKDTGYVWVH